MPGALDHVCHACAPSDRLRLAGALRRRGNIGKTADYAGHYAIAAVCAIAAPARRLAGFASGGAATVLAAALPRIAWGDWRCPRNVLPKPGYWLFSRPFRSRPARPRRRRNSTAARPIEVCMSATVPAAATTSTPACSPATWASTSRAIPRWCRRTWTAPAACGSPTGSTGRARATARCSARRRALRLRADARQQGRAIRRQQVHLDRQRQRRSQRLRRLAHLRRRALRRLCRQGAHGRLDRRLRRHLPVPRAFVNNMFGTRFKIVPGYPGGNDVNLAMERGEVRGPLRLSVVDASRRRACPGCPRRRSIC